jgi:hypothetical protein
MQPAFSFATIEYKFFLCQFVNYLFASFRRKVFCQKFRSGQFLILRNAKRVIATKIQFT